MLHWYSGHLNIMLFQLNGQFLAHLSDLWIDFGCGAFFSCLAMYYRVKPGGVGDARPVAYRFQGLSRACDDILIANNQRSAITDKVLVE